VRPPFEQLTEALERARADVQAASDRLARLEDHVRRMLEATHDGYIVFDVNGVILEWSPGAESLLGWSRAEVLNRRLITMPTAVELVPGAGVSQVLAPDGPPPSVRRLEIPMSTRSGKVLQVSLNVWASGEGSTLCYHAFLCHAGSCDEHGHAGHCTVGSIVISSGVAMIGEDLEGRIVAWNRAASEMYGYSPDEALGRLRPLIIPSQGQAEFDALVAEARQGRHVPGLETVHLRRDGTPLDVSVTVSPVRDLDGSVTGVSLIARDITEQRRAAAALGAELEQARESEATSHRFLADAAHQLRTPIAGIRACADTLAGSGSVEEGEVLLAHMIEETSRAGRLIRGLLRVARVDRGVEPVLVPCDLAAVCAEEAGRLRLMSPQLEVTVRGGASGAEGQRLDPDLVREILGNLLDNASRHALRRITLDIGPGPGPGPGQVEVRVSDDGPGLAEDKVEGAFERFVSLDGRGGSGLGLPIARGLARSHGGDLTYEDGAFVLRLAPAPRQGRENV